MRAQKPKSAQGFHWEFEVQKLPAGKQELLEPQVPSLGAQLRFARLIPEMPLRFAALPSERGQAELIEKQERFELPELQKVAQGQFEERKHSVMKERFGQRRQKALIEKRLAGLPLALIETRSAKGHSAGSRASSTQTLSQVSDLKRF